MSAYPAPCSVADGETVPAASVALPAPSLGNRGYHTMRKPHADETLVRMDEGDGLTCYPNLQPLRDASRAVAPAVASVARTKPLSPGHIGSWVRGSSGKATPSGAGKGAVRRPFLSLGTAG